MRPEDETVFEQFRTYPWHTDKVFQAGLSEVMTRLANNTSVLASEKDIMREMQLLKSKHFYFSKFQRAFDLQAYLQYEQRLLREQQEKQFQAVDDYDYDHDEQYREGLKNIISQWVEQQSSTGLWDNKKLDFELRKVKAFYYHLHITAIDVPAYMQWSATKEINTRPACPFASSWQNKNTVVADQSNGHAFVMSTLPTGVGAKHIVLSSSATQNLFSCSRLKELHDSVMEVEDRMTSLFISATVANAVKKTPDDRIETRDTNVVSSGVAYEETYTADENVQQVSLDHIANLYYNLADYLLLHRQMPNTVVSFTNGRISLSVIHLFLYDGFLRVITEHTLVDFQLKLSHSPVHILLPSMLKTKSLPSGIGLYLALGAPEYAVLRGPELLFLGLADFFIPEAKLADAMDTAKAMACCSQPTVSSAILFSLYGYQTYAGPNRISVWKEQIKATFGSAASFEELESLLKADDTKWSRSILSHWSTLPPCLLRIIFKAVESSQHMSGADTLALERKLNCKWRRTEDYRRWLKKEQWVAADQYKEQVAFCFENNAESASTVDPFVYTIVEAEPEILVCPVTGQKSSPAVSGCPMSQQTSLNTNKCPVASASVAGPCPVSGQTSIPTH